MKRLTYAEDGGSQWKVTTSFAAGNQVALTATEKGQINGDQSQTGEYIQLISAANTFSGLLFKFPKATNIEKIFTSFRYTSVTGTPATTLLVEASANSTDGNDGTWATIFTESHTIRAANSDSRLFLQVQTEDELSTTYTWIRISWSGNANLNNLRVMSLWIYGEYSSPAYDFYDSNGITKMTIGEVILGAFAGNAVVDKTFRFKMKNNEATSRTYTLTFAKVKATADAAFAAHIGLSTDGTSSPAASINLTIAGGEYGDFFIHVDVPINGAANGNPQDGVHYGKITVTQASLTEKPGFFIAMAYDTLANIELLTGTGLVNICLVYQRDLTDEGEIGAWSIWDAYGVASYVQQEAVGNDIVLLLTSDGYLWEMDRGEFDNEEFAPEPILLVMETVELPSNADPHIWRRNLYFDFDVNGADGGILAEYQLTALKQVAEEDTTQDIHIGHAAMRVALSDAEVGFQFRHRLKVLTGGALEIKNFAQVYQDISIRARLPYIAGV